MNMNLFSNLMNFIFSINILCRSEYFWMQCCKGGDRKRKCRILFSLFDWSLFFAISSPGYNQRCFTIHFLWSCVVSAFSLKPWLLSPSWAEWKLMRNGVWKQSTLPFPPTKPLELLIFEWGFFQLILRMPFNWFSFSHFHWEIMFLFNHHERRRMIHVEFQYRRGI